MRENWSAGFQHGAMVKQTASRAGGRRSGTANPSLSVSSVPSCEIFSVFGFTAGTNRRTRGNVLPACGRAPASTAVPRAQPDLSRPARETFFPCVFALLRLCVEIFSCASCISWFQLLLRQEQIGGHSDQARRHRWCKRAVGIGRLLS